METSVAPERLMSDSISSVSHNTRAPRSRSLIIIYLQCYFVTIATILGTGILGLPVTLAHSGIYPFLVSFLGGFIMQVLSIVFFTDLLQRAYAVQLKNAKTVGGSEAVPLKEIDGEDFDELDIEEEHESNGPVMAGHIIIPKDLNIKAPNLHLLGKLFLGCGLRQMFDAILLIQFIAFLISYALAGSQAYAQVIGVNYFYIIPVFVWILTLAIVFALQLIQPIVSILTFGKGSLLLGTVVVTFFVGASIHHEINNDFSYLGEPFLMGTVALGGIVNVMPFLYSKIQPVATQIRGFRCAIILGLTTCTVLNILWCWSVLDIVPQTNSCFIYDIHHNNTMHTITDEDKHRGRPVCSHNLSLESAAQNGEISTIPLTTIIHQLYPAYDWVALLVELFIMISITVSFLTIGAAMHHTLSGWVESVWDQDSVTSYVKNMSKRMRWCNSECICRAVLSLTAFSLVFAIAMLNPKGFESMLEKGASLFSNLEMGIFVFLMVRAANVGENEGLRIPLPMYPWTYYLIYLLPLFFCFAVGYDVYLTLYDFVKGQLPGDTVASEHEGAAIVPIGEIVFAQNFSDTRNTTYAPYTIYNEELNT